jgi:hypothetical protein
VNTFHSIHLSLSIYLPLCISALLGSQRHADKKEIKHLIIINSAARMRLLLLPTRILLRATNENDALCALYGQRQTHRTRKWRNIGTRSYKHLYIY